jgi:hypothetical protein
VEDRLHELVLRGIGRGADFVRIARNVLVEDAAIDVARALDVEAALGDVSDDVPRHVVAEGPQIVHRAGGRIGAFRLAAGRQRERIDAHETDAQARDVGSDLSNGVRQRPGHALVVERGGRRDFERPAEFIEPGLVGHLAALPIEHENRAHPQGAEPTRQGAARRHRDFEREGIQAFPRASRPERDGRLAGREHRSHEVLLQRARSGLEAFDRLTLTPPRDHLPARGVEVRLPWYVGVDSHRLRHKLIA